MINNLREKYKIEKSNIEKSYEYQIGLKNNSEYEQRVDNTFLALANLLKTMYPTIKLESPRGREKSIKSLKNKIEKLEIERLCKLYAVEGLSKEEIKSLYKLISDSTKNANQEKIQKIFFEEIQNLKEIDKMMQDKSVEDYIKTALLRITKTKLQKENTKNSITLQNELEQKYGESAARTTKQQKSNLLHWECIKNMDVDTLNKLHNPFEYLKAKDLRAFKFVIADVPDDIKADSEELNMMIERRKNSSSNKEKSKYNDLCCIALAKEFANKLINDEELLKKLNIEVLPEGYKHKQKQNGYIAEHIKFCYRDHPEYTFELQLRSIYRENLSRANGTAAHDKRSGKKRKFPSTSNKTTFIRELNNILPQYRMLECKNNKLNIRKCTLGENMLEYFLGYVDVDSKEYKKAMQYIKEEQVQK